VKSSQVDCCPGTLGEIMDIKEVIKRIEKAFPKCEIGSIERTIVKDSIDRFKLGTGWRISIVESEKDDKK